MPLVEAKAAAGWIEAWWNNWGWEDIYLQMIWLCYIQEWARLFFFVTYRDTFNDKTENRIKFPINNL